MTNEASSKRSTLKKTICMIAVALVLTFFASGIMVGCDSKNPASAANAGKNAAKKIETTINRLDVLEDKDFRFPTVFENDFFADETMQARTSFDCPPGAVCRPRQRNANKITAANRSVEQRGYRARHIGNKQLNQEGAQRTKFLDQFDDLYVLCADVSSANAKCKERIDAIKEETAQLRQLSNEMKKSGKKGKDTFAKFNLGNKQVDESVRNLRRDRNRVKSSTDGARTRSSSVDVEAMTVRNLKIMNKVENRLKLLEDLHKDVASMNESMRLILGKQEVVEPQIIEPMQLPTVIDSTQNRDSNRYRTLPYIISW